MSFVFPILLGGLVLVGIPVLLHLLHRQKPRTLRFPAFRFLVQRHKTNLRKLQLRHLLLLLLRMGLLALIALAVARPRLVSDQFNLSTDRPVAAILLFDTSPSMEYQLSGGQSRLADAKKRGLELLDELPAGSRFLILDSAERVSSKGEWLTSLAQVRQRIDALKVRYDSAPVTTRLLDAYRLFAALALDKTDEVGQQWPRFLCIFSDGRRACWDSGDLKPLYEQSDAVPPSLERLRRLDNTRTDRIQMLQPLREQLPLPTGQDYPEQTIIDLWQKLHEQLVAATAENYPPPALPPLLAQLRQRQRELLQQVRGRAADKLPEAAREYRQTLLAMLQKSLRESAGVYSLFVDVGVDRPADLAIVELELPPQSSGREPRQLFAPTETFVLRTRIQATGKDFSTSVVCEVDGQTFKQSVALKKGEQTYVPFPIDCQKLEPGPHQVQVRLTGKDLLDFNNRRFVTFAIRPAREVLLITDDAKGASLWKQAIESREDLRLRCTIEEANRLERLEPKELAKYHAVYLFDVARPSARLWSVLQDYVERGGGLAIVPAGEQLDRDAYNKNKSARELLPATFTKVVGPKTPGVVWNWDADAIYQHPLLKPVQRWKQRGQDDFIQIPRRARFYWQVEPVKDKGSVLVSYVDEGKPPALLERHSGPGHGRVLLLTTRLDRRQEPAWNNYMQGDTSFVVILPVLLTEYLAGDAETARLNFLCGQGAPQIALPAAAEGPAFTLIGPAAPETIARPPEGNTILLREAVQPGNYVLESTGRQPVGAFSLNVPGEESNLQRVPVTEIEDLLGVGSLAALDYDMSLGERLQEGLLSEPLELLPYLLLGLLVILALENLLANLFYRREA